MNPKSWLPALGGLVIVGFIVWRLGTGPFLDGLRLIDLNAILAATCIGALTTTLGAWRWTMFAAGLCVPLPLSTAIARCYRATFLNATLPIGVLGDVHRAVGHGREAGSIALGIRAVVWERAAGQVVQVVMGVTILFIFPSPVRSYMPAVAGVLLAAAIVALVMSRPIRARLLPPRGRNAPDSGAGSWARLLPPWDWAAVIAASIVIATGHLATFLLAARVAGVTEAAVLVLPLLLLALMGMLVPANIGGFGPREGVAAWAFSAAGLSAAQGVSSATAYGVLVLAASLPGALVLIYQSAWRAARTDPVV